MVQFEKQVEQYLGENTQAAAFDSARSSFYLLLEAFGIGEGDEVLMPAFTCVVVVNSVLKAGAKPIYVDIDKNTFNIDLKDLENKMTDKTKAVLVQHTFGLPVSVEGVRDVVGEHVKIIEDMAHSLGAQMENKAGELQKLGTFGDGAILTFGIEKIMTSLRGGMAVVKDRDIYMKLKMRQEKMHKFGYKRIFTWLVNPLIWSVADPLYYVGFGRFTIGRIISEIGHRLKTMGNMMEECEYGGQWPAWMPAKMPGVLAKVGMNQLSKLDKMNAHRREIAGIYDEVLGLNFTEKEGYTPVRYSVLVRDPEKVHKEFKKEHIILGNWYERILFTNPKFLTVLGFSQQHNPVTVEVTKHVVNLPTFIKVKPEEAKKIAEKIKPHLVRL